MSNGSDGGGYVGEQRRRIAPGLAGHGDVAAGAVDLAVVGAPSGAHCRVAPDVQAGARRGDLDPPRPGELDDATRPCGRAERDALDRPADEPDNDSPRLPTDPPDEPSIQELLG